MAAAKNTDFVSGYHEQIAKRQSESENGRIWHVTNEI